MSQVAERRRLFIQSPVRLWRTPLRVRVARVPSSRAAAETGSCARRPQRPLMTGTGAAAVTTPSSATNFREISQTEWRRKTDEIFAARLTYTITKQADR